MVVDRKNQKVLALLYLVSGPWRNAANTSGVPNEFAAEPTTKMNFRNLTFLPEYSFELFLSLYRYLICFFFLKF